MNQKFYKIQIQKDRTLFKIYNKKLKQINNSNKNNKNKNKKKNNKTMKTKRNT